MISRTNSETSDRYLTLLKHCLTRYLFVDEEIPPGSPDRKVRLDELRKRRAVGRDWPPTAETMAGLVRLDNVQTCVTRAVFDHVPGDLLEAGVWRGGATILMRALLDVLGDTSRSVWIADSFEGLPVPDTDRYPADAREDLSGHDELAVDLQTVRENFERYGLLDERVLFLPGLFKNTLRDAPIDRLSVLRVDGDYYESTMDVLVNLYPKVSPRGFVIIDDYSLDPCREAVLDYRAKHAIDDPMIEVDWTGIYWRKGG